MHKILHFLLLFLPICGFSQTEATLLYHWSDNSLTPNPWLNLRYNEVWGFARDGHEYGVIGTTDGMRIFDVTNPTSVPDPVVVIAPATGGGIIHRDMKDWNGYLYAVCDEGSTSTLQIIDCHQLPAAAPVVYNSNEFVVTAHNVFIDTSQNRLYLLGVGSSTKVLDISNPTAPVLLAQYPTAGFSLPYVHDAYIHNHIGIMNCGGEGLWVVDFSDPVNPTILGTMTNYPGKGYNHSGWMSADGRHYILCDETHGSPVKMVDFADFADMQVVSSMNPGSFAAQIPHNALVRENLLFVSYYYDGLQVFDISDPAQPVRVAYYDTYTGPNEAGFAGSWGVYPNLPSGNVLLSDLNTGFWVFSPIAQPADYQLRTNHPFLMVCEGEEATLQMGVGADFTQSAMLPVVIAPDGALVDMPATAAPGTSFEAKISGLTVGHHTLEWSINDGTHTGRALVHVFVKPAPTTPQLVLPADGAVNQPFSPVVKWNAIPGVSTYTVEVSTSGGADFDANIFFTKNYTNTSVFLSNAGLQPQTTYYWRVKVKSTCGDTYSAIFHFTTKSLVSTFEVAGSKVKLFPNPVTDRVTIDFETPVAPDSRLELRALNGQLLRSQALATGKNEVVLSLTDLAAGQYLLQVYTNGATGQTILIKQ